MPDFINTETKLKKLWNIRIPTEMALMWYTARPIPMIIRGIMKQNLQNCIKLNFNLFKSTWKKFNFEIWNQSIEH